MKKLVGSGELDALIKEGKWEEVIMARTKRVKWLYDNRNRNTKVVNENLVWLMVEYFRKEIIDLRNPQKKTLDPASNYDASFGDDRVCRCGHLYRQHFDSAENMRHIGCKYCDCYDFKEKENKQQV